MCRVFYICSSYIFKTEIVFIMFYICSSYIFKTKTAFLTMSSLSTEILAPSTLSSTTTGWPQNWNLNSLPRYKSFKIFTNCSPGQDWQAAQSGWGKQFTLYFTLLSKHFTSNILIQNSSLGVRVFLLHSYVSLFLAGSIHFTLYFHDVWNSLVL